MFSAFVVEDGSENIKSAVCVKVQRERMKFLAIYRALDDKSMRNRSLNNTLRSLGY